MPCALPGIRVDPPKIGDPTIVGVVPISFTRYKPLGPTDINVYVESILVAPTQRISEYELKISVVIAPVRLTVVPDIVIYLAYKLEAPFEGPS
jgi:hypothetical protein